MRKRSACSIGAWPLLSREGAIYLTQAEPDDTGDLRFALRARVPPSRASHTLAGALVALTESRPRTTAGT